MMVWAMMNSKNPKGNRCMKNNCEGKKFREKPLQEKSLGMCQEKNQTDYVLKEILYLVLDNLLSKSSSELEENPLCNIWK
jgi:hypothetical protein